jgi:glycosyltransferase involved in cell wall biosynthesis
MPIYNGEAFLREATDSILSQTYSDFDFLVIDDGSSDTSAAIIRTYSDPRIQLLQNTKLVGIVESLNNGLDLARGEYVARMDCDDISLSQRLARQVAFMDSHPEVGACGMWVKTMGEPAGDVWQHPTDPEIVKCRLLFESVIAHPSAMMRRNFFGEAGLSYRNSYPCAEDYDLWVRCAKNFPLLNIPDVLLLHRIHSGQVGLRNGQDQRAAAKQIRLAQVENLGIKPTNAELELHQSVSTLEFQASKRFITQVDAWLQRLQAANEKTCIYPEPAFSRVLGERWFAVCNAAPALGLFTWKMFWRSPLSRAADLRFKKKVRLLVKTGLAV